MIFHLMSQLALKVAAPRTAYRVLRVIGRARPLTVDGAAAYTKALGARGTCLSRSISIASRMCDASIAIGVISLHDRPVSKVAGGLHGHEVMRAHAWVEVHGEPLSGHEAAGSLIGYLDRWSTRAGSCGS